MNAEKGGALVRSSPGLVGGVDAFNAHIGKGGAKWGHPTPPHLPLSGNQPQQLKNECVTKLPSGGKETYNSKNSRKKKHGDKVILQNGIEDDDEITCGCEASTRVRQLEHDFDQLHKIHDAVLKGLHQQMEELKQKNRDLTFQLLMGPYATSVQVGVPQSPESDSTTTPKKENKKEDKSTSTSETELEISPQQKDPESLESIPQNEATAQGEKTYVRRRQRRGRAGDPRQVRSLDIELLEEEADELRKELEKERDKNSYLIALTEDLKRQIRDENGSWHPPQLPATKIAMQPPIKPMPINISSHDSQTQRSDVFLSSESSLADNQLEQNVSGFSNAPNRMNKTYDKNRTPLPTIRKQVNDLSLSSNSTLHLVEELKVEVQGRAGPNPLPKPRPQLGDIVNQDRIGKAFPFGKEQTSSLGATQTRKDQRPRKQQETSRSNDHFIFQSPKKLEQTVKSKKLYHQHPRQTITDQLSLQELPQQTKIKSYQRRRSSSGSMTRANGNSKPRSLSSQGFQNSTNIGNKGTGSKSVSSETKTSNFSPESSSEITSSQYEREQTPLETPQPLANGDMESVVKTDLTQSSAALQESKQRRPKGAKVEFSSGVTPTQPSASSIHKGCDTNMTSSSSSVGSLASGNGRPKNKGRPHRRGRGRNKKDASESKVDWKRQS